MEYIRVIFENPRVPILTTLVGLTFMFITLSKYSFVKNEKAKAAILAFSPLIMIMVGFLVGVSFAYRHSICAYFSFLIGCSFMGLLGFYNLRRKQLIVGILFICLYLYLILVALTVNRYYP